MISFIILFWLFLDKFQFSNGIILLTDIKINFDEVLLKDFRITVLCNQALDVDRC